MWQNLSIAVLLFALSACAPMPPLPGDAAAKRFEPVPDRAVIYLVRNQVERDFVASIMLNDQPIGATYKGTYIRMVVPAGTYRIAGMAGDSGSIRVQAEQGKIYFVDQRTMGYDTLTGSTFQIVNADFGRSLVLGGTMTSEIIR